MTKLVIGSVANHPFAVRAERVDKTVEVKSFSRFMRGQRDDVVAAVIESRVQFLTDLSVRLGLNGLSQTGRAGLITAPDQQISGILAQDPPTTINVEDESVLPVSSYVGTSVMEACALIGDQLVPILSDEFFAELQQNDVVETWTPSPAPEPSGKAAEGFIGVRVGELHIAFDRDGFHDAVIDLPPIVPLPFAPPRLVGLARLENEMVAVVDVRVALGLDAQPNAAATTLLPYEQSSAAVYFLVSDYLGVEQGREVDLPKLLRRAGIGRALETGSELVPVVAPSAVLESVSDQSLTHKVDSIVLEQLFTRSISVTEFSFGDFVYAVPSEELGDEPEDVRTYPFWATHPLVKRVATCGAAILPQLDLSGYLGHDPEIARSAPLRVKNGEFEAVFSAERVIGTRVLEPRDQKPLPAELPHNLVYACYLDGKDVRLILNLTAIAEHATDEQLQNVLASISTANRTSLATGKPSGKKTQPVPFPPVTTATETAQQDETERQGESVEAKRSTTDVSPAERPPDNAAEPEPEPEPLEDIDPTTEEQPIAHDRPEPADAPPPDVELDLEHAESEGDELADDSEDSEQEMQLEIESPLTIDPQMATWQRENGVANERATHPADEHGPAANDLQSDDETPVATDGLLQKPRLQRQKRRRALSVALVLLAVLIVGVGGLYVFQRSLFSRLLAQAQDAVGSVIPSGQAPADTLDESSATEDMPRSRQEGGESPREPQPESEPLVEREPPTETESAAEVVPPLDFTERVYFAADSAELQPQARETLDRIVERVNAGDRWRIEIIGHVARAQHGSPESFSWLSEQRAITVRDYLLPRLDVAPAGLSIIGRGATDPAASNATPNGRALNRRVQVIVEPAQE